VNAEQDRTRELLSRWNDGDEDALTELIGLHADWLRRHVGRRLGGELRTKLESGDIVQDSLMHFLRDLPRFEVEGEAQFRALMARIIENRIRDTRDWFHAKRRTVSREQRLSGSVADLSPGARAFTRPDEAAAKLEMKTFVRLALELLEPDDQHVIVLRQWEGRPFEEVGGELGISPDAARMRFNRALKRLADQIEKLKEGEV